MNNKISKFSIGIFLHTSEAFRYRIDSLYFNTTKDIYMKYSVSVNFNSLNILRGSFY